MKNRHGMKRSAEYMKAHPQDAPDLHHMRIHKHEDGVRVTHHSHATAAPHAEHHMSHHELPEHVAEHFKLNEAGANEPDGEHPPQSDEEY
jgi:hypothetical protein